jgi:hypothetical protein
MIKLKKILQHLLCVNALIADGQAYVFGSFLGIKMKYNIKQLFCYLKELIIYHSKNNSTQKVYVKT